MTIMLILIAQAAAATSTPPPVPVRFSILANPQSCHTESGTDDIVVCGEREGPRLPLPDDRGPPEGPQPSNPELTGTGALAASATPCAASQWGCQVGIGPPPVVVKAIVDTVASGIKAVVGRKVDKSRRVVIPLDDGSPLPTVSSASTEDVHP